MRLTKEQIERARAIIKDTESSKTVLDALEAYERANRLVIEWAGTDDPTVSACANELMDALGYN